MDKFRMEIYQLCFILREMNNFYEGRFNHYYKLHSCLFLTSTACKTEAKRHFLLPSACSVPKLWPIFCGNVFYVKDDYTVKFTVGLCFIKM